MRPQAVVGQATRAFKRGLCVGDFKVLNTFAWGGFGMLQRVQLANKARLLN